MKNLKKNNLNFTIIELMLLTILSFNLIFEKKNILINFQSLF